MLNCRIHAALLALAFLSACAAPQRDASAPRPAQPAASAVDAERCEWEWREGGGIGVWAERCRLPTGLWALSYDAALPGFALTVDGGEPMTVLQVFEKPEAAGVDAILPELRRRGLIPDDGDCRFEPAHIRPAPRTLAFYEIRPTGARLKAFEATPADEIPEPPCGEVGWSTHGVRYFMTDIRHPDRVIYVNTGQDGTLFDERSITLR